MHPAIERPRVWFDDNAGSWVYRLPGSKAPVQAESWAAAMACALPARQEPRAEPVEFWQRRESRRESRPGAWWRRLLS